MSWKTLLISFILWTRLCNIKCLRESTNKGICNWGFPLWDGISIKISISLGFGFSIYFCVSFGSECLFNAICPLNLSCITYCCISCINYKFISVLYKLKSLQFNTQELIRNFFLKIDWVCTMCYFGAPKSICLVPHWARLSLEL